RSGLRTDRQNGIPVTTPARTLIDCIPHLPAKHLRRATSDVQIDGQRVMPISYAQVVHDRRRTTARLERILEGFKDPTSRPAVT
ncbi:MAG: hypothetical protein QOF76_1024, partial [Solirubrobacteraceae bacterium]|nr:hypothetical protein [Solirubrobacteraceae bacterium]